MIIYISGLYTTGDIGSNILAARKAALAVWQSGNVALTPHLNTAHFEVDCSCTYDEYIRGDLALLARCDAILMLPGWEESNGAKIELEYATENDIPVYHYPDLPPLNPTESATCDSIPCMHEHTFPVDKWQSRPLEDALRARVERAEGTVHNQAVALEAYRAEAEKLQARVAELESSLNQTIYLLDKTRAERDKAERETETLREDTTIGHDEIFIFCEKCRTILPPQIARYQWGYCPACGRMIEKGRGE